MAFDILLRGTTGATQGAFPGTSIRTEHTDKIEVTKFFYEMICPKDPSRGQATGRRQHRPVEFSKDMDATTPLWFTAAATNEFITTLTFEFWQTNEQGIQEIYMEITLENAAVAAVKYSTGGDGDASSSRVQGAQYDRKEQECLSLVFETIKVDHLVGTVTSAQDSWKN